MIHGNLTGIRESTLEELEKLYDAEFERDIFLPDRLLNILVRHTQQINREMLVYLGRDGTVLEIAIGSIGSIALPELHLRRNLDRLSGFRCIHTHPGGDARLSDVDLQALRLLRFKQCEVILFQVLNEAELEFPYRGRVELRDLESGQRLELEAEPIRASYLKRLGEHNCRLGKLCDSLHFMFETLSTSTPFERALAAYFAKREKLF